MISRHGVVYNLRLSWHKCTYEGVTYYFSSKSHLAKFKERLEHKREAINNSLSNRFKFNINVNTLADVILYREVETRGFAINYEGAWYSCPEQVTFAGGSLMRRSLVEQSDNLMLREREY